MAVFPSASPKDYPSFGDISRDFMTKRKTAQQNDADARAQSTPLVTPSAGPPSTDTAAGQDAGGYPAVKTSQAAGGQAFASAGSSVQTAPQSNPLDEYYAQMKSAQRAAAAAQAAQTRAAVEALQGNRRSIEQDAEEAAKQAYISRMLTEKRLPQQLAATGSSGGMTDSAVLRINSDYENSRNDIMNARNNALADLNSQIAQVEATGDISLAQQQSEWAQQLAQMQWQLAQQEAERQHELDLAAINASKSGSSSGTPYKPRLTYAQTKEQLEAGNTNDIVLEAAEYWGLPASAAYSPSAAQNSMDAATKWAYDTYTDRLGQLGRSPTVSGIATWLTHMGDKYTDDQKIAFIRALGFDPAQFIRQ